MRFSKKIFFGCVILFFITNILLGQRLDIKIDYSLFTFSSLTHISNEIPKCALAMNGSNFPDCGIEYSMASGIIFSSIIGIQKEQFDFTEGGGYYTYGGPLRIHKSYKSFPIVFSSGYANQIGKSHFHFNAMAGIGFGMVHSADASNEFALNGFVGIIDRQGQYHNDSENILLQTVDSPMKKIMYQARISIALEYDEKRFFIRSFIEARSWLSDFENIKYHADHYSNYFQYSSTVDGHFSVRAGYWGLGIGIGWYFINSKT